MAGDTRDSGSNSPPPISPVASNSSSSSPPKTYETFTPLPNANGLPDGAGRNTAGSHAEVPKLSEAVKTVRFQDFKQVHMYPCVRDSLLIAIGGAFGMGGVRVILGGQFDLPAPIAASPLPTLLSIMHCFAYFRKGFLCSMANGGLNTAPILRACNWAVGTFCFGGIASYEFCQQKRRLEKVNMKRAVEIMDRKKAEKEAQMRKAAEERRRAKEEVDRQADLARKSSWKFW